MKKLKLEAEQLRVESFPVQGTSLDNRALPTDLPYTCPECPYTRNVLCY